MATKAVFLKHQLPAILWAALVFIGSSIPGRALPPLGILSWDKLLHACEFGIFALLLVKAYGSWLAVARRNTVLLAAFTGIVWALLDELHQLFVPGRDGNIYDFLADAVGVVAVLAIYTWVRQRKRRRL